ncbi:DUF1176 domain-containing protein [Erythrobacter sp. CCH5-A1]|uniref:DUF1176 domain-containing protein n=1 Tax=Erythrobacter sp. CCH5-A1 TaxID=1768792 RepID=UPI0008377743|nr:DUF1176 domain-containing protein [Erythrobacter sp. CCH5-A1]
MLLAPLLAAASAVLLPVAPVPPAAQFKDWSVACDNTRRCEAVAAVEADETGDNWVIHVVRGGAADAVPVVEATPIFGDPVAAVGVLVDGQAAPFGFDVDGLLTGDPAAFLAALARARKVEVAARGGAVIGTLPTSGASAGLRWIDDRQRRAGTVTAIVARGRAPASAVPARPALPRIAQPPVSAAPPRILTPTDVTAIRALGDCDGDVPPETVANTYRLDAAHTLGIVGCYLGAYQGPSVIVVIDEAGRWTPAVIEQAQALPKEIEGYWSFLLTSASYDPESRLLGEWAKGRGLADCGRAASWAWDGAVFRLAYFAALDECRGAPPGTWMTRWQTANAPLEGAD